MLKKIPKSLFIVLGFIMFGVFFGTVPVNAEPLSTFGALTAGQLKEPQASIFPQNNIYGWNPYECTDKNGIKSDSCFKIDSNVGAQEFWYAEGCLNTGDCSGGLYFASGCPPKSDNGLVVTGNNTWIYNDTQTDNDWGGMQYIYAENYDVENYDGAYTKMTPNGGSSTQKYYWIVLPDQAYSNGFGDTYVATFENFSEPVYFIVFDTHACGDQSENYCGRAEADPNGVEAGREFFGAFTRDAGSPTAAADIAGKLTSLCRINGSGEVTVASSPGSAVATGGESSSSSDSSSTSSEGGGRAIAELARAMAWPDENGKCIGRDGKTYTYNKGEPGYDGTGNNGQCAINARDKYIEVAKELRGKVDTSFPRPDHWNSYYLFDCQSLVNAAVVGSGVDEDWPRTDNSMLKYAEKSSDWEEVDWGGDESKLQPGDVYIRAVDGSWKHVAVFIGEELGDGYGSWVDAHWGRPSTAVVGNAKHYDSNVKVFRYVGNKCTSYEGDYPQYFQGEEPWGGMSYGPGCTFAGCACGATSMAMLATYVTGQDVLPTDVADLLGSSYYWQTGGEGMANLDKQVCDKYGCEVETVSWSGYDDAIDKIKQYLNDGYVIHLSGLGGYPFSSVGHYIGIFSIKGDNVMIANSASSGNAEINLHDMVYAGMHYAFSAIKGSGSRNSCDNNDCPTNPDTTALDGGLTEEQAQKIADYYNSDAVSASGLPMGTKENCVSFSAWFVSYLTNVAPGTTNPTSGDGLDVAGNLVSDYSLSGGDTPQVWSVFSNPSGTPVNGSSNHTGVIVGIENGEAITIEAAWGGWAGSDNGLARVWRYSMPESGMYYAYLSDHLENSKISEIVGGN